MRFTRKELFYAFTHIALGFFCLGVFLRYRHDEGGEIGVLLLVLSGPLLGRGIGELIRKPGLTILFTVISMLATFLTPTIH